MEPKFVYSFTIWPSETWGFKPALFDWFRNLMGSNRSEWIWDEGQFERFRSALNHDGFTMREIERVPYVKPEIIK